MYHLSKGGVLNLATMLVSRLISPKCVIVTLRFHYCLALLCLLVCYLCHRHFVNYCVTGALLPPAFTFSAMAFFGVALAGSLFLSPHF